MDKQVELIKKAGGWENVCAGTYRASLFGKRRNPEPVFWADWMKRDIS